MDIKINVNKSHESVSASLPGPAPVVDTPLVPGTAVNLMPTLSASAAVN